MVRAGVIRILLRPFRSSEMVGRYQPTKRYHKSTSVSNQPPPETSTVWVVVCLLGRICRSLGAFGSTVLVSVCCQCCKFPSAVLAFVVCCCLCVSMCVLCTVTLFRAFFHAFSTFGLWAVTICLRFFAFFYVCLCIVRVPVRLSACVLTFFTFYSYPNIPKGATMRTTEP